MNDKYSDKVEIIASVKDVITSYIVIRELSEDNMKSKFIEWSANSFNKDFIFKKNKDRALSIKVRALTKELYASLDERGLGFNSSRMEVLKKYKRIVAVPGKQGYRIIHIPLKNAEEVYQLLQDLNNWL